MGHPKIKIYDLHITVSQQYKNLRKKSDENRKEFVLFTILNNLTLWQKDLEFSEVY